MLLDEKISNASSCAYCSCLIILLFQIFPSLPTTSGCILPYPALHITPCSHSPAASPHSVHWRGHVLWLPDAGQVSYGDIREERRWRRRVRPVRRRWRILTRWMLRKRFYLGIINRLKKIRSFSQCDEEVAHLLMRNKDIESDWSEDACCLQLGVSAGQDLELSPGGWCGHLTDTASSSQGQAQLTPNLWKPSPAQPPLPCSACQARWTCSACGSKGASGSWAGWWREFKRRGSLWDQYISWLGICVRKEHFMIILYLVRKNATKIYLILNISIVHAL